MDINHAHIGHDAPGGAAGGAAGGDAVPMQNLAADGAGFRHAMDIERDPAAAHGAGDAAPAARPIRDDDTAQSIWNDFVGSKQGEIDDKRNKLDAERPYTDEQHGDAQKLQSAHANTTGMGGKIAGDLRNMFGMGRPARAEDPEVGGHGEAGHAAQPASYKSMLGGMGTRLTQWGKHTNRHDANMRNVDELHKRATDLHSELTHGPQTGFGRWNDQLNEGRAKIGAAEGKVNEKTEKANFAQTAVGHRAAEEDLAANGVQRASNKLLREVGAGDDHGSEKVDGLMENMDNARKGLVGAQREHGKAQQEHGAAQGELADARAGVDKERNAFKSVGYDVQDGARKKMDEFSKAYENWNNEVSKTKMADKNARINDVGKLVGNLPTSLVAGALGAEVRLDLQKGHGSSSGGHTGT